MRQWFAVVLALCVIGGVRASAQSPQTQPLLQAPAMTYLGSFAVPDSDGSCGYGVQDQRGCLAYGGVSLGVGPVVDGQPTLYIGGHDWSDQLCQITVPAIGGTARVVGKCQTITKLSAIDPQGGGNGYVLGGALLAGSRLLVSAYAYYPGSNTATATHFVSTSGLPGLTGAPIRVGASVPAATVAGYMGTVPAEWQSVLGGPALTGLCCTSIISRSSYGPAVGVFDPAAPTTSYRALVMYPDEARALSPYGSSAPTNKFNGSTMMGGVAFPSGSRSVLFIGRQGTGERCYGTGTSDKALHRQTRGGDYYCYDPANGNKGDHAWPYVHQVWAYDANDLAAVKAGSKQPWQVQPYAIWTLPGLPSSTRNQGASIASATYDDATRRLYVTEAYGDKPRVHVFAVAGATAPPPAPVDCVLSEWGGWVPSADWSACIAGQQTQPQIQTRAIVTPPANGGAACGPLSASRSVSQACTVAPPAPAISCTGTIVLSADGTWACTPKP